MHECYLQTCIIPAKVNKCVSLFSLLVSNTNHLISYYLTKFHINREYNTNIYSLTVTYIIASLFILLNILFFKIFLSVYFP